MATEKSYSRVEEAETIIANLCEKYPDELWQIKPGIINVLGIENKERSKSNNKLATVKAIRNPTKAILQINNVVVRYVIELYWSDWNQWSLPLKQWIIFHELQHIGDEIGKLVKHDSEDFRMILDAVGVDWVAKNEKLPLLLGSEKVKFNLSLRPIVAEYCQESEIKEDAEDENEENAEESPSK